MRSSNEMYERGVRDAQYDDLNLFYYQHYYHYRRGYDRTRRRVPGATPAPARAWALPNPVLLALGALLVLGGLIWYSQARAPADEPSVPVAGQAALPSSVPAPAPTAAPVLTATTVLSPTEAPPQEPVLQAGGQAIVSNVGTAPLRARTEPSINAPVQARFPDGMQVQIIAGPVEADGYTWWQIEADNVQGWSAATSATGTVWLRPLPVSPPDAPPPTS